MAWIYSQVSGVSVLPLGRGSIPLLTVKTIDTAKAFCSPECILETCPAHQSGMMFGPYGAHSCRRWTLSSEDFHARTSAQREMERVLWESEADFISKSKGLSKRQTQLSSSLKMSLQSGQEDLDVWCADWPASGMIVDGQLYQPKKLEPLILGKDGFSWPTPKANDAEKRGNFDSTNPRNGLPAAVRMMWPTPKASDAHKGGPNSVFGDGRPQMPAAAALWATPRARDHKDRNTPKRHGNHSPSIAIQASENGHPGYLSPLFLEAIMGYPKEWTVCEPWVIQSCLFKRKSRLKD